jgi:two-component system, cell cycle response regulator
MTRGRRTELSQTTPIPVLPVGAKADGAAVRPLVLVVSGERVGTRCVLDAPLLVGRDPDSGLALRDAGISWHHAHFEVGHDGVVRVLDLGSTNGTFVNDIRVEQSALADGDIIELGETILRLEMADVVEAGFHDALDRLINEDDMTGLVHQRRWDTEASLLIEAAEARRTPLALLLMDLDGVKRINDTHGHHFGAYTISEAGRIIGAVAQGRGLAARIGGDEYAVILADTDAEAAIDLAHEVREAIRLHRFEVDGVVIHPGISIGVATLSQESPDLPTLVRRADAALYRAKSGGRDRVAT